MNQVRNPEKDLNFSKVDETKDYTEYEVSTNNTLSKEDIENDENQDPFTNYLQSFIFYNETMNIKVLKSSFMKYKKWEKEVCLRSWYVTQS